MTDDEELPIEDKVGENSDNALPKSAHETLALGFARECKNKLRFTLGRGWARYDGKRWDPSDSKLAAGVELRKYLRNCAVGINDPAKVRQLCSSGTNRSVEFLLLRDESLRITADEWDANPWDFNTPAGTVDLRNGKIYEHSPGDYITKIAAVGPKKQDCPLWSAFMNEVTDGDEQLQAYIQRLAGYMLTGSTREHALFFMYGTGANGKSVFIDTITEMLGDYAATTSIDTFTYSRHEKHSTDIARLWGTRLATAIETEEGKRWDESKIKSLTGSDRVTARFMRQDNFEYRPQFKLLIAGNHKPPIRSVDESMRRRLHLIPFDVTIPKERRDQRLAQKLKKEWPGILSWMIQGCLDWQREGLNPPPAVTKATEEYLQSEDVIGRFLVERCVEDVSDRTYSAKLYEAWKRWAEDCGEHVTSNKAFSQKLIDRGYTKARDQMGFYFEGIALAD